MHNAENALISYEKQNSTITHRAKIERSVFRATDARQSGNGPATSVRVLPVNWVLISGASIEE